MWLVVTKIAVAGLEFARLVPAVVYVAVAFFAFGFVSGCHGCR